MKPKTVLTSLIIAFMFGSFSMLHAQSREYKDGSAWNVSMIKVKPGMGDEYLKSLKGTLKLIYDEAIKQGLLMSYKVLQGAGSNREDFDIMIMTEYKNLAAMEGHEVQWEAIRDKVVGGADAEKTLMKNRLEIREIMGEKLLREVIFN